MSQAINAEQPREQKKRFFEVNYLILAAAFIVLAILWLMPTPDGLSVAGWRAIGILAFAVIVWVSEAVSYPVEGAADIGTSAGVRQAMSGLATPANTLVLMALFLAAAMQATSLHKRLALWVLRVVGESTNAVLIGAILVATILAFFVPSATARAGGSRAGR